MRTVILATAALIVAFAITVAASKTTASFSDVVSRATAGLRADGSVRR
jgi:hypothetical protein